MIGLETLVNPVFRYFYKRRSPQPLGDNKPRLKWFPKYEVPVAIHEQVLSAPEPDRALEKRLATIGFELESWTPGWVHYTRGKKWGDFSVKLIRLRASFPTPLAANSALTLEVADVCLFDTGDCWKLAREMKQLAEEQTSE